MPDMSLPLAHVEERIESVRYRIAKLRAEASRAQMLADELDRLLMDLILDLDEERRKSKP